MWTLTPRGGCRKDIKRVADRQFNWPRLAIDSNALRVRAPNREAFSQAGKVHTAAHNLAKHMDGALDRTAVQQRSDIRTWKL